MYSMNGIQQTDHASFPHLPSVLGITVHRGHLQAETSVGALPLYCFLPFRLAVRCGQTVAFASHWPEPLKPFIYQYLPLPRPGQPLASELTDELHWQARDPTGLRPWDQVCFRGWPLYLYLPGSQVLAGSDGQVPELFGLVSVNLPLVSVPHNDFGYGP